MNLSDGRTGVLHVVDSLRLGGIERMAVELANLLDPDEFDASLCATREAGPLAGAVRDGVRLTVLSRRSRWDAGGIAGISRLVRAHRVEIVHTHGRGSAKLVALSRAVARLPVRHVFHDHFGGVDRESGPGLGLRLACRWGVDAYVGVHPTLCQRAVAFGMPPGRVHLVRNGIDLRRFPPRERVAGPGPGRPLRLVAVAGLRPDKDHPTLLRAVGRCRHRDGLELHLVGVAAAAHAGHVARCRRLIDELGLGGRVTVMGGRNDVPAVLAGADIGVLSSRTESGPLAVLEYMAAELPFVVTDTGELTAQVRDSGAGVVVPVGDVAALADAIDRLAGMEDGERRAMGSRGRALVAQRFDQRDVVERVAAVYRSLLAQPAAPGRTSRARSAPGGGAAPC